MIALYTGKGIPMLWHGQEFAENWGLPGWGIGRNLFERPLHWEYFYDAPGQGARAAAPDHGQPAEVQPRAARRGFFYYFAEPDHLRRGVVAYRREAPAGTDPATGAPVSEERLVVLLNFSDAPAQVWVPFPRSGRWHERIDGTAALDVAGDNQWTEVIVPSNYGAVYAHG